jgi:hypothetical protein
MNSLTCSFLSVVMLISVTWECHIVHKVAIYLIWTIHQDIVLFSFNTIAYFFSMNTFVNFIFLRSSCSQWYWWNCWQSLFKLSKISVWLEFCVLIFIDPFISLCLLLIFMMWPFDLYVWTLWSLCIDWSFI